MNYNFEEVLNSMSLALDLAEMSTFDDNEIFDNETNIQYTTESFLDHSKKTTYIALELCKELGLSNYLIEDIYLASLIHDIGAIEALEKSHANKEFILGHCITGSNLLRNKIFNNISDIIRSHHENWNGSGPLKLKGNSIPIGSQIIRIADVLAIKFITNSQQIFNRDVIISWVKSKKDIIFSSIITDAFLKLASTDSFWLNLCNIVKIPSLMRNISPKIKRTLTLDEIEIIAYIFSQIVDKKSPFTAQHSREIADLSYMVAKHVGFDENKCQKMKLAGLFHDIGKLAIPSKILNKNGALSESEFNIVKSHAYYTNLILSPITGLDDVREWATNHHEKLNGTGYPNKFNDKHLSLESRILAVCDIYQALTEDRPYREGLSQEKAFDILNKMASDNLICIKAVKLLHEALFPF
ncbi:HD-GYP domain-containing protein [Oceanirhabdus sp. W0125-5]|uniref:HD-GYP domain-containing protein n=1 Tax=Oceanirhabdus sp. W0125-5 TaxID=2999116 RepID=UPI0022F33A89|nr:HD-GYP domain-containing protein [Oceanirhabdus sp. W0125-5]WBW98516.1 HD domain-containing protein [Oceanirhabdus sp. W0125-5]